MEQNASASASSDAHSFLYYLVQSNYSLTIMDHLGSTQESTVKMKSNKKLSIWNSINVVRRNH
jgi:hypothetical protein